MKQKYSVLRCRMSVEAFNSCLNEAYADGYKLHSWQLVTVESYETAGGGRPFERIITTLREIVFERIEG